MFVVFGRSLKTDRTEAWCAWPTWSRTSPTATSPCRCRPVLKRECFYQVCCAAIGVLFPITKSITTIRRQY